jgi:hypothetical protein
MINKLKSNKILFGIILLGILAFVLPITLLLIRDSQDLRSSAAAPDALETEAGVFSSSGVTKQTSTSASGGQYVKFAKTSSSSPTPTPNPNISYTDYNVPTTIDKTGATDVTTALNNWIATIPNGTSTTKHTRVVFPQNATYMVSRGINISGKSHVTYWGNGTTIKVNPNATGPYQYTSAFNVGYRYGGSPTANLSAGTLNTDIRITGFSGIASHTPTPGIFNGTYENQAFIEATRVDGLVADNCKNIRGFGGDFMRLHGSNVHIHDVELVNAGRQGVSVIEGSNVLIENSHFGDVGYYVLDLEPNRAEESVTNVTFRYNTMESWGPDTGVGGGFLAIGNGVFSQMGNVWIHDNEFITTGKVESGQETSTLRSYINHRKTYGLRPFNINIYNNKALQADAGPLIRWGDVDGIRVTGNTQPLTSGSLTYDAGGSTNVVVNNNITN